MRQYLVSFMKTKKSKQLIELFCLYVQIFMEVSKKMLQPISLFFGSWQKQTWPFENAATRTEGKSGSFAYCVMEHLMKLYIRSFSVLNDYFKKRKKGKKTKTTWEIKQWAAFTEDPFVRSLESVKHTEFYNSSFPFLLYWSLFSLTIDAYCDVSTKLHQLETDDYIGGIPWAIKERQAQKWI